LARLTQDIAAAGTGLLRLARRDPKWPLAFDLTARGFWRSFAGPLLAAPIYVLASALAARADGRGAGVFQLCGAAGASLLDGFGFPLLMAVVASVLGFKAGYGAFVTVYNWAALYLTLALLVAALPATWGEAGLTLFEALTFLLLVVSVYVTARTARETLSRELAPIALVVVVSVAWGAFADQAASWVVGALASGG
jgi:hypothetical protein